MSEKSLEVKITADVTSLKAASAVAKAELNALNLSIRSTAKEAASASGEMKEKLNGELLSLVERADQAAAHLAHFKSEIAVAGVQAEVAAGPFAKLSSSILEVGERAEAMTGKIADFTGVFGKLSEFAAVGLGADVIGEQIEKVAELGESYSQLQEKTGATIPQLAGLRLAAMETGTSFDTVGNGLRSLGSKMQDSIIHPSGEAAQAFKALNVSATDSSGQLRPVVDVFADISAAMATFQDGAAKTALAGDVMGAKFGSALIPVMNETGQGFGDLQDRAQQLGLVMTGSSIDASEQFIKAQKDTGAALDGLRETIIGSNLPAFTALEQEFVIAAQDGGVLNDAAISLELGLKVLGDSAVAVVTAITEIADAANFVGQVMGDVALVADGLAHGLAGDFGFARASVKVATADIANDWTDMLTKMKAQEALFTATDTALWTATPAVLPAATMNNLADHQGLTNQPAPQIAPGMTRPTGGGGDGGASRAKDTQDQITQIAQDAAEARKSIATSEYEAQVSNWDSEVATGKMTKAQEIQDEISAMDQIYQANLAEAQEEVTLAPMGTAARAKALDDLEVLTAQHNADIAKMNADLVNEQVEQAKELANEQQQAAEATSQAWQKAFAPVTQAFDESINGIIQGTQTMQQAEIKAAQSVTLAFIDAEAKKLESFLVGEAQILVHGVATQLGLTEAVIAGNSARLAAQSTANATGKAEDVALGTAQINANAMKAASGAYAAVAGVPIVGPVLAPAAAATAYAAVMAFDVPSAEGGMVVRANMNPLVQLHEKEMVLPSHIAQPLQAMVSDGGAHNSASDNGGDVHLHMNSTINASGMGADQFAEQVWSALNTGVRSGAFNKYPSVARMMRRGK